MLPKARVTVMAMGTGMDMEIRGTILMRQLSNLFIKIGLKNQTHNCRQL
jgi:hypothetical protein